MVCKVGLYTSGGLGTPVDKSLFRVRVTILLTWRNQEALRRPSLVFHLAAGSARKCCVTLDGLFYLSVSCSHMWNKVISGLLGGARSWTCDVRTVSSHAWCQLTPGLITVAFWKDKWVLARYEQMPKAPRGSFQGVHSAVIWG